MVTLIYVGISFTNADVTIKIELWSDIVWIHLRKESVLKIIHLLTTTKRKSRSVKRHKLLARDNDGSLREIRPEDTLWYQLYVNQPPQDERMAKLFRNRFRLLYESFLTLSEEVMNDPMFARWTRSDAVGEKPMNVKLLLLGCLRYIGRSWTLDDICESNGISVGTNRLFLLTVIEWGSTVLYKKWVIDNTKNRDVNEQESIFRLAGFNGCIGSSDGAHIAML